MDLLVIGGSDAGVTAALRARELAPDVEVTVVVADEYPNYSICGIPYHVSGDVPDWRSLAHRTRADLEATGMRLRLNETAVSIDPAAHVVQTRSSDGDLRQIGYDKLIIATGAVPVRPPIQGLDQLGAADGVHVLHSMDDTFALTDDLDKRRPATAAIIGAGYIGVEMAEALSARGLRVTVFEQFSQVLPNTLDPALAKLVETELVGHGVEVLTGVSVGSVVRDYVPGGVLLSCSDSSTRRADVVLVVTGVRPETSLAAASGAGLGVRGAIIVDERMRTSVPDVYAAGDCVHTHHRLLDSPVYLPLGTTAHKQGRVAGENAIGGDAAFAGVCSTQVVKVFDTVVAATGFRDSAARDAGFAPLTVAGVFDDHKAYYPGSTPVHVAITGDRKTGRLLGAQLVGRLGAEISKRVDTFATAITYVASVADVGDLDLSYTPPLGSPYDAVQLATQAWTRAVRSPTRHVNPREGRPSSAL
ncbi:FAD-dependent oxidoreductase [Planotetraspora kaengkrachanensis]|uniref:Putative pyridine nucleotide-disulphide oxidoreductase n=1 Tax=Planotetraspora kaengkrachanensis TaxID=575193 RepID=A0A8J3PZY2_9ACTN|nr:FAD-dependent oxidoreductase [Planotetraspora kaengkrachanensis]GIG84226.1 putative pyridine nucleotide-disulphide oxidoreductase [Planotetraspora kaengkrachanensis]